MATTGVHITINFQVDQCDHHEVEACFIITQPSGLFLTALFCWECSTVFDVNPMPGNIEPLFLGGTDGFIQ